MSARTKQADRHRCVIGLQWGDEGKGKIVDVLAAEADVVVRYQGGANAGHTVLVGDKEYVFHLIPSGILSEGKVCAIGNGVVLDPRAMVAELEQLTAHGLDREASIFISDRAHVVLPWHAQLDAARESSGGAKKIGTTLRGIGPCYMDKAARTGIRMGEFVDPALFPDLLRKTLDLKNRELGKLHGIEPLVFDEVLAEYGPFAERLRPRVCDIADLLWERDRRGDKILFEGAQGALLDLDLGTYPYVTSSSTSFLGLGPGTGFSPRRVDTVLGVTKAYTTRVGEGPFPTELDDATAQHLSSVGAEFGATTGRARRCGWLDAVALGRTLRFCDADALVVTKLDVLDGLEEIRVAVGYAGFEGPPGGFPSRLSDGIEPIYETRPGWKQATSGCRSFGDLPPAAKAYLQFIADRTGCPIAMVSVGKERSQTIRLDPWLAPSDRGGAS